ncbi:hypothetical protein [Nocardia sp. NPDC051463]|uniref:hypothetical protein n=1 Tax=Nocardia sp. NPDC051463 TaxID=3154845 RepID=UPI00344E8F69
MTPAQPVGQVVLVGEAGPAGRYGHRLGTLPGVADIGERRDNLAAACQKHSYTPERVARNILRAVDRGRAVARSSSAATLHDGSFAPEEVFLRAN